MTRCVVTGASGLLGSHLVPLLLPEWEVHAVSRRRPRHAAANWHPVDLSRPFERTDLPETAEAVVYLAQSENFRDFPERAEDIFEVNVASVQRMLAWAQRAGVRRFVLASSGGLYGHGSNAFREEDTIAPTGPLGYYLASKRCAELLTESYAGLFTVVVLRFFFVYGPGQRSSMLIPRLVHSISHQEPVVLHGPDGIRLNPTYVSDAVHAVSRALELKQSQIVNVAGPDVTSMRELATLIGSILGQAPVFDVRDVQDARHLIGDTGKMERLLGAPGISLNQGLREFIAAGSSRRRLG